ncbi:MAG: VOC family protein [Ectothiorhodospiraceae bacterium]|nr:VOC family protein [Ectothiorhodospiraceae bacterium]MCH8504938.1 VOC family protein [Ectothiorhodospiraceae bacterium]
MRLIPEIYTERVSECRQFYCDYLGFAVEQEMDGFVVLRHAADAGCRIMFCVPDSPFVNRIFRPAFHGQGLILQIDTEDVDADYARFRSLPVRIVLDLVEEEVNGRHFTIADPNGLLIDIVQVAPWRR